MIIENLVTLFHRDLNKLKLEIEQYQSDDAMWLIDRTITNSAGNLCLHLIGNLNAYIGVGLAKTNYVRERPLEFSLKNIPRQQLLQMIDNTIAIVEQGLNNLTNADLSTNFPFVIWDAPTTIGNTLLLLLTHLNYHLGQINYHRRLLDVKPTI